MKQPLTVLMVLFLARTSIAGTEPACPNGNYQKAQPSPETDLQSCNAYKCNSCCSSNITKQISITPLQQVGRLNYHQCNRTFSSACSKETSYMECFYQCSPNLFPWFDNNNSKLSNLPICAQFCEQWFQTCKNDYTCVDGRSWITGLNKGFDSNGNPVDPCKPGTKCQTYKEVYGSPEYLCNYIWSGPGSYSLLKYTNDTELCLIPSDPSHNAEVVKQLKGNPVTCEKTDTYTDTGMIVGIVFGVLGGLFLIGAGVAFYLRSRKGGTKTDKPKETNATPEEMTTMKVEPSGEPDTPPNTRDASDVE